MANATTTAEKAAAKAKVALAKIIRQRNNERTPGFFAAGIVGIILLFMLFYWTRFIFKRYESKTNGSLQIFRGPVRILRRARSLLLRKMAGFASGGHALIFAGYLATCITVAFVNVNWNDLIGWAKRLGWVAVSNLALVTFLSLKNTPLSFLTSCSYERLNVLHRVTGYSTIFWALLHAVVYIKAWSRIGNLHELLLDVQIFGIIAAFAFLIMLATALTLRRFRYEVFYIIHIVMFILILIMVGMHRPDFAKKTITVVIFTGSMWILDRILRFAKISIFSLGNLATITPLPHGGTRIVVRKSPWRSVSGNHCFLWVPAIRAAETHPFTIVSAKPLEFVIASYNGFTRDLHEYALKNPGKSLKASIDGPYGKVPDFTAFTKALFIAGGSGASFSLGVAADLVRRPGNSNAAIEIVWVIREQQMIEWFEKELEELQSSRLVTLHIYSTRKYSTSSLKSPTSWSSSTSLPLPDVEKPAIPDSTASLPVTATNHDNHDIEKHPEDTGYPAHRTFSIQPGRPNIANIITSLVDAAETNDRIAVAACGPQSLMEVARKTVAGCTTPDGPSLELYCEQFGF